jgi:3-oxoacyl-[acyl-carrier-protein] synthase-1
MNSRTFIHDFSAVCAMGRGKAALTASLRRAEGPGMGPSSHWRRRGAPAFVGAVTGDLPAISMPGHDTRNNRILQACLEDVAPALRAELARVGPRRFAIVAGTSTSGIAEAEDALLVSPPGRIHPDYDYSVQEFGSPAAFLRDFLDVKGPCFAISTACTSSTNAFISARRLLRHGMADAVLVVGADSLCRTTVEGFNSLEAVSANRCLPFSRNRCGINIGEGAGIFLLSREPGPLELLGAGESCDAFHLSSPDPRGRGAEAAIRAALKDAGLAPPQIDYVNLHGTGTQKNDEMESLAMARVFGDGVPCSGTKGLTGHALGAAGAIEAALCCLAITQGTLPPHVWDGEPDPALPSLGFTRPGQVFPAGSPRLCMTNNFAFGGSNVSLVLGPAR